MIRIAVMFFISSLVFCQRDKNKDIYWDVTAERLENYQLIPKSKSRMDPKAMADSGALTVEFLSQLVKVHKPPTTILFSENPDILTDVQDSLFKNGLTVIAFNDLTKPINFRSIEDTLPDLLLYLFVGIETPDFENFATSRIRRSGGRGYIIFLMNSPTPKDIHKFLISPFYQTFIAVQDVTDFKIFEKCAYCYRGENSLRLINEWSVEMEFKKVLQLEESFKGTFNGASVNIAFSNSTSGVLMNYNNDGTKIYSGAEYDMIIDMSEMLNFKFVMKMPEDREWGRFANGNWTGLVGLLDRGEAEIAVGVVSITEARYAAINPTALIRMEEIALVSAKPAKAARWQSVYEAFTLNLWMLSLVSLVLTGTALYVTRRLSDNKKDFTWGESVFIPFRTLCFEPVKIKQPGCPTILILWVWMLMTVQLIGFYTGSLTSLTMTPVFTGKTIDSGEDLALSGKKWIAKLGSITYKALERYPELDETRVFISPKYPLKYSLHWVLDEPLTMTRLLDTQKPLIQAIKYNLEATGRNPIYIGKDILMIFINTWIVTKTCPYSEAVAMSILQFHQCGLSIHYNRKMFRREKSKVEEFGERVVIKSTVGITLPNFLKMSMVFSFGYVLACLSFLFELCVYKVHSRGKNGNNKKKMWRLENEVQKEIGTQIKVKEWQ